MPITPNWMAAEGYAASTIYNALGIIANFYRWCDEWEIDPEYEKGPRSECGTSFNPAAGAKRPRIKRYDGVQMLSRGEVEEGGEGAGGQGGEGVLPGQARDRQPRKLRDKPPPSSRGLTLGINYFAPHTPCGTGELTRFFVGGGVGMPAGIITQDYKSCAGQGETKAPRESKILLQ
jgi:hypothetical protein